MLVDLKTEKKLYQYSRNIFLNIKKLSKTKLPYCLSQQNNNLSHTKTMPRLLRCLSSAKMLCSPWNYFLPWPCNITQIPFPLFCFSTDLVNRHEQLFYDDQDSTSLCVETYIHKGDDKTISILMVEILSFFAFCMKARSVLPRFCTSIASPYAPWVKIVWKFWHVTEGKNSTVFDKMTWTWLDIEASTFVLSFYVSCV